MMSNLIYRDNRKMELGLTNDQILQDYKQIIEDLNKHQKFLDENRKNTSEWQYSEWTRRNQMKLAYAKQILDNTEKRFLLTCYYDENTKSHPCPSCGSNTKRSDGTLMKFCCNCGQGLIHIGAKGEVNEG